MSKTSSQFDDYLSLAIMLLMFAALLGGQVDSTANAAEDSWSVEPAGIIGEHLKDSVIDVSIAVATDLSQFRGEDE